MKYMVYFHLADRSKIEACVVVYVIESSYKKEKYYYGSFYNLQWRWPLTELGVKQTTDKKGKQGVTSIFLTLIYYVYCIMQTWHFQ